MRLGHGGGEWPMNVLTDWDVGNGGDKAIIHRPNNTGMPVAKNYEGDKSVIPA